MAETLSNDLENEFLYLKILQERFKGNDPINIKNLDNFDIQQNTFVILFSIEAYGNACQSLSLKKNFKILKSG